MASHDDDNKPNLNANINIEREKNHIDVKKYDAILNNKDVKFDVKVQNLIDVWTKISELNLKDFESIYVLQIIDWAKLHALNIVLMGEWRKTEEAQHDTLLEAIKKAQDNLNTRSKHFGARCQKLLDVVKKPWEDPILNALLNSKDADIGPKEIEYFCVETAYLISVRLKKLCENHCEDLALNLTSNFLKCNKLSKEQNFTLSANETQIWYIVDTHIALLYKYHDKATIIKQFEELALKEGVDLISRFSKKRVQISKVWKHCHKIAMFGARFFLSKALMNYSADTRPLLLDLMKIYIQLSNTEALLEEFIGSVRSITNLADAAGLYALCKIIHQEADEKLRHFAIEMYIRALTTDMNELERLKHQNEHEKVDSTTSRLANSFMDLSELLDSHVNVARECVLTGFSLEPTKERLQKIEKLAERSGFQVLDTGQEWKCKLHPPVLPTDDLAWMCSECGDWMCKPALTASLQTNFALNEALQPSALGISQALCDDLVVCLSNPRYQVLSWLLEWNDLYRLCIMYLNDPEKTKNFITELKFVDIDYSQFQHIKKEPIDEYTGIEKGYEQYLDMDFVSDDECSNSEESQDSDDSSDEKKNVSLSSILPKKAESNPTTLKSLRMFRPNLKRKNQQSPEPEAESKKVKLPLPTPVSTDSNANNMTSNILQGITATCTTISTNPSSASISVLKTQTSIESPVNYPMNPTQTVNKTDIHGSRNISNVNNTSRPSINWSSNPTKKISIPSTTTAASNYEVDLLRNFADTVNSNYKTCPDKQVSQISNNKVQNIGTSTNVTNQLQSNDNLSEKLFDTFIRELSESKNMFKRIGKNENTVTEMTHSKNVEAATLLRLGGQVVARKFHQPTQVPLHSRGPIIICSAQEMQGKMLEIAADQPSTRKSQILIKKRSRSLESLCSSRKGRATRSRTLERDNQSCSQEFQQDLALSPTPPWRQLQVQLTQIPPAQMEQLLKSKHTPTKIKQEPQLQPTIRKPQPLRESLPQKQMGQRLVVMLERLHPKTKPFMHLGPSCLLKPPNLSPQTNLPIQPLTKSIIQMEPEITIHLEKKPPSLIVQLERLLCSEQLQKKNIPLQTEPAYSLRQTNLRPYRQNYSRMQKLVHSSIKRGVIPQSHQEEQECISKDLTSQSLNLEQGTTNQVLCPSHQVEQKHRQFPPEISLQCQTEKQVCTRLRLLTAKNMRLSSTDSVHQDSSPTPTQTAKSAITNHLLLHSSPYLPQVSAQQQATEIHCQHQVDIMERPLSPTNAAQKVRQIIEPFCQDPEHNLELSLPPLPPMPLDRLTPLSFRNQECLLQAAVGNPTQTFQDPVSSLDSPQPQMQGSPAPLLPPMEQPFQNIASPLESDRQEELKSSRQETQTKETCSTVLSSPTEIAVDTSALTVPVETTADTRQQHTQAVSRIPQKSEQINQILLDKEHQNLLQRQSPTFCDLSNLSRSSTTPSDLTEICLESPIKPTVIVTLLQSIVLKPHPLVKSPLDRPNQYQLEECTLKNLQSQILRQLGTKHSKEVQTSSQSPILPCPQFPSQNQVMERPMKMTLSKSSVGSLSSDFIKNQLETTNTRNFSIFAMKNQNKVSNCQMKSGDNTLTKTLEPEKQCPMDGDINPMSSEDDSSDCTETDALLPTHSGSVENTHCNKLHENSTDIDVVDGFSDPESESENIIDICQQLCVQDSEKSAVNLSMENISTGETRDTVLDLSSKASSKIWNTENTVNNEILEFKKSVDEEACCDLKNDVRDMNNGSSKEEDLNCCQNINCTDSNKDPTMLTSCTRNKEITKIIIIDSSSNATKSENNSSPLRLSVEQLTEALKSTDFGQGNAPSVFVSNSHIKPVENLDFESDSTNKSIVENSDLDSDNTSKSTDSGLDVDIDNDVDYNSCNERISGGGSDSENSCYNLFSENEESIYTDDVDSEPPKNSSECFPYCDSDSSLENLLLEDERSIYLKTDNGDNLDRLYRKLEKELSGELFDVELRLIENATEAMEENTNITSEQRGLKTLGRPSCETSFPEINLAGKDSVKLKDNSQNINIVGNQEDCKMIVRKGGITKSERKIKFRNELPRSTQMNDNISDPIKKLNIVKLLAKQRLEKLERRMIFRSRLRSERALKNKHLTEDINPSSNVRETTSVQTSKILSEGCTHKKESELNKQVEYGITTKLVDYSDSECSEIEDNTFNNKTLKLNSIELFTSCVELDRSNKVEVLLKKPENRAVESIKLHKFSSNLSTDYNSNCKSDSEDSLTGSTSINIKELILSVNSEFHISDHNKVVTESGDHSQTSILEKINTKTNKIEEDTINLPLENAIEERKNLAVLDGKGVTEDKSEFNDIGLSNQIVTSILETNACPNTNGIVLVGECDRPDVNNLNVDMVEGTNDLNENIAATNIPYNEKEIIIDEYADGSSIKEHIAENCFRKIELKPVIKKMNCFSSEEQNSTEGLDKSKAFHLKDNMVITREVVDSQEAEKENLPHFANEDNILKGNKIYIVSDESMEISVSNVHFFPQDCKEVCKVFLESEKNFVFHKISESSTEDLQKFTERTETCGDTDTSIATRDKNICLKGDMDTLENGTETDTHETNEKVRSLSNLAENNKADLDSLNSFDSTYETILDNVSFKHEIEEALDRKDIKLCANKDDDQSTFVKDECAISCSDSEEKTDTITSDEIKVEIIDGSFYDTMYSENSYAKAIFEKASQLLDLLVDEDSKGFEHDITNSAGDKAVKKFENLLGVNDDWLSHLDRYDMDVEIVRRPNKRKSNFLLCLSSDSEEEELQRNILNLPSDEYALDASKYFVPNFRKKKRRLAKSKEAREQYLHRYKMPFTPVSSKSRKNENSTKTVTDTLISKNNNIPKNYISEKPYASFDVSDRIKEVTEELEPQPLINIDEYLKNRKPGEPLPTAKEFLKHLTDKRIVNAVLRNVPGLYDLNFMTPRHIEHIVNVAQVSGTRTQNVTSHNSQTSTQVTPHIQRIGQPVTRVIEQKPPEVSTPTLTSSSTVTATLGKPLSTQPSTLINILSQQIRPGQNIVRAARPATGPLINILSQQIIRPGPAGMQVPQVQKVVLTSDSLLSTDLSQTSLKKSDGKVKTDSTCVSTINATKPIIAIANSTSQVSTSTATSGQGGTILQFICKSSLPKFQQAFGKCVSYQKQTNVVTAVTTDSAAPIVTPVVVAHASSAGTSTVTTGASTSTVTATLTPVAPLTIETKKIVPTKTVPINLQPLTANVIYRGQVPVGQTISLIPPGSTTRQLFRITGTTNDQMTLVKETVIQNKMHALLAAALQAKPKNAQETNGQTEDVVPTRITLCKPNTSGSIPTARIVKPLQVQIPAGAAIRAQQSNNATNVSSTTLEQLREFDMVYKQVKERSSTSSTTSETTNSPAETQDSPPQPQRISFAYVQNPVQKFTQLSPVVVVSSYNHLQAATSGSPALTVISQGNVTTATTQAATCTLPKIASKTSKSKSSKSTTSASINQMMKAAATIPKAPPKPQEDEQTTQRIFDILAEYAEQLRNSPDLNNKPAPRRRSNPPTNPGSGSKRRKSSTSKKTGTNSSVETDTDDWTMGSEDSSNGNALPLSATDDEQSQQATSVSTPSEPPTPQPSVPTEFKTETPQITSVPSALTTPAIITSTANPRPFLFADPSQQTNIAQHRNVIIADSSVGEALKIPNTALIVPGSYIVPVSMVKGAQQIVQISGGNKILTTVPARPGQNMLVFQGFLNQNRKVGLQTVKYSTIQPLTSIAGPNVATIAAQPHQQVVFPQNVVTLGQPLALKKLGENGGNKPGNEYFLTISQPKELSTINKISSDVTQPDSSTNAPSEAVEIKIEDVAGEHNKNTNSTVKVIADFPKTCAVATSVIASCIKEEIIDHNTPVDIITDDDIKMQEHVQQLKVDEPRKPEERIKSVLVNASSANGPMFSHTNARYRKRSESAETIISSSSHNGEKVSNSEPKIFNTKSYFRAKKHAPSAANKKLESEMQKQAALERELRLQKSLSEECEDLGVDEPSTSDLFPEADLLFDANHSPAYEHTEIRKSTQATSTKTDKTSNMIFSDDENSGPMQADTLFDYVEYPVGRTVEYPPQLLNGNNDSIPLGDDTTLLNNSSTMQEVTLHSPISSDMYTDIQATNKYKYKYSNRKRNEKNCSTTIDKTEVTGVEVVTSKTSLSTPSKVVDQPVSSRVVSRVESPQNNPSDLKCQIHCNKTDEDPKRGARRSLKKLCACCNGTASPPTAILPKKRPLTPSKNPKKAFPNKKR